MKTNTRKISNTLFKYDLDRNTTKIKMTLPPELKYIRLKQSKKSIYSGTILNVVDLTPLTLEFLLKSGFAVQHATVAPAPTYWYTFRTDDNQPFVHPTAITVTEAEGLIAVGGFEVIAKTKVK